MRKTLEELFRELIAEDQPFMIYSGGSKYIHGYEGDEGKMLRLLISDEEGDPHFSEKPLVWVGYGEEIAYFAPFRMDSYPSLTTALEETLLKAKEERDEKERD